MNDKIDFTIAPPKGYSCCTCDKWGKYPWDEESHRICMLPEGAPDATWGKCNLEGAPRYMNETYFSYGCNKHSRFIQEQQAKVKEQRETAANAQLSLF